MGKGRATRKRVSRREGAFAEAMEGQERIEKRCTWRPAIRGSWSAVEKGSVLPRSESDQVQKPCVRSLKGTEDWRTIEVPKPII